MIRFLLFIFTALSFLATSSAKELEVSREFTLFTSQQAGGYLKPLFTTIGESFNSGLYTNAGYVKGWSIGLDFTATQMYIPETQRTYDAVLPDLYGQTQFVKTARKDGSILYENVSGKIEEPTLYGGRSYAVFAAPQNHFQPDSFYKSVAFVEGNDISSISGLPILQLVVGTPLYNQFRFRFFSLPLANASINYLTIAYNQNINKLFDLFEDDSYSLSTNFAYHTFSYDPGVDVSSMSVGLHFSKTFDFNLTLTAGAQYEGFSGKFKAVRDKDNTDIVNSPYREIRDADPIEFDIESYTNYRIGAGLAYRLGFLELHSSFYYASQPVLSAGVSFWLFEQKPEEPIVAPIPPPQLTIPEPEPLIVVMPEPVETVVPEMPTVEPIINEPIRKELTGDVAAFSVEDGTEKPLLTINMEENISRHISPLLPMLFFDENSSVIPSKYSQISPDSAARMGSRDVSEGNALDVYYQILNVIGKRMQNFDEAKLTLIGTNSNLGSERNNKKLSQQRADNVKDYLVNVWKIDPKRINVQARNLPLKASNSKEADGVVENRRVEIQSDTWEIIAPSVIQDTARMILPTYIRFRPTAKADAGLANWKLNVMSNTQKIKENNGYESLEPQIDWIVRDDEKIKAMIKNNLQYNLSLTDKDGTSTITEIHTLPVKLKTIHSENAAKGDTITNIYDLILFDFDKSTLSGDNQRIINLIKKEMPDNAIVKVVGFTDRMGNDIYNQKLSSSRAKTAANALGKPSAEILGSGETRLLYNNDLPEGRFYSRTVIIEVKIPVK